MDIGVVCLLMFRGLCGNTKPSKLPLCKGSGSQASFMPTVFHKTIFLNRKCGFI